MLISLIVPLYGRHNVIDLSSGFAYDISLLIPVSNQAFSNTQAVVKPFQWPVSRLFSLIPQRSKRFICPAVLFFMSTGLAFAGTLNCFSDLRFQANSDIFIHHRIYSQQ